VTHYNGSVPETRRKPDWRDDAVCATDQYEGHRDLWFPNPGDHEATAAAKRVCATCPVRQACLDNALTEEGGRTKTNRFGIRGGKTTSQRYNLYAQARKNKHAAEQAQQSKPRQKTKRKSPEPAKCGTRAGYQKHLREKTAICGPCRQANTDADNRLRRTGTTKAAA
jgi:hypothetical protein